MLQGATLDAHEERIQKDGYTVVEDVFDADFADTVTRDLTRLEKELSIKPAQNRFEGSRTLRVYNLVMHGKLWEGIPVHENVLPLVERVLDEGCLISSLSSVKILPGETPQPIHADDQLIPLDKPHAPVVCNTMWAFTEFTEENGATRVVPGSHLYDSSPVLGQEYDSEPALMRRGSVLVYHGSLWHGGGMNRSEEPRIGIPMNYCAGFIRQQENQQLGIPFSVARGFSTRLRELVGYSVYKGLIGHIAKKHPAKLLETDVPHSMIWDVFG